MTRILIVASGIIAAIGAAQLTSGCGEGPSQPAFAETFGNNPADPDTTSGATDVATPEEAEFMGEMAQPAAEVLPETAAAKRALSCPVPQTPPRTYHVCDCASEAAPGCVAGQDTNPGTALAPWRSYEKARLAFQNLAAGEAIAFCRGGAFNIGTTSGSRWVNAKCRPDKPCVIRDYVPSGMSTSSARPKLRFRDRGGFAFDDGGDANHEAGYMILGLNLIGNRVEGGLFFYNDIDDVTICNMIVDGFDIGVHVAGSNPVEADSNGLNERITLRNSLIRNCSNQGWLGGCNDCRLEYNQFNNNGFGQAVFDHNVYLSDSSGQSARRMRVVGNDLYRSAFIDGKCRGVSMVVHGLHDDLLIDGNVVHEDVGKADGGCWGIAVDDDGEPGKANGFRRVTIQNNKVINLPGTAIGLNACADCVVQNNIVIIEQAGEHVGINIPDKPQRPIDVALERVTVRNNTVVLGEQAKGTGIVVERQGSGHSVSSNAVHYLGTTSEFRCFSLGLPSSAYSSVNYNLCYPPRALNDEWERGSGRLANWRSLSGLDLNSQWAAPLFVSVVGAASNLAPGLGSPLIGRGDPVRSAPFDQLGRPRPLLAPSIGALEP